MPDSYFQSAHHHELTEEETRVERARTRRAQSLVNAVRPSLAGMGVGSAGSPPGTTGGSKGVPGTSEGGETHPDMSAIRRAKSMNARMSSPSPIPIEETRTKSGSGTGDTTPLDVDRGGSASPLTPGPEEHDHTDTREGTSSSTSPVRDDEGHVLVVDWEGADDPENPKKYARYLPCLP